jgi:hypothetical protein
MVLNFKPGGTSGFERPKLRWLRDIEADIKALSIIKWRINA